ncbi:MAG: hypothetical protein RIB60_00505 [Phycisphaerales bacterium]
MSNRIQRALLAAIGTAGVAWAAHAQEVVVQNDSFSDGGTFAVCPCFAAGEEAAVWLTSPCDGEIVGFQIFWKSFLGGTEPSIEESIKIYEASENFPTPGALVDELLAPVLTDGFLNEFRDIDGVPISIPVAAGETFVVSLRFFNSNASDTFAASVGSDDSGCQASKNTVRLTNGTWRDACQLGVSGDWVIRAIVSCGEAQGACCLPDGSCADGLTLADCTAMNGFWNETGSLCADVACTGACYVPATDTCLTGFDKATCDAVAGDWQGPGTTECDPGCFADCDDSGALNLDDVDCFVAGFLAVDLPTADCDGNGVINLDDLDCFVAQFLGGCP